MGKEDKFWLALWGVIVAGILILILIGTHAGYLDDIHDQQMADKGYNKVKTLSCTQYKTTTEYKLNITGDK